MKIKLIDFNNTCQGSSSKAWYCCEHGRKNIREFTDSGFPVCGFSHGLCREFDRGGFTFTFNEGNLSIASIELDVDEFIEMQQIYNSKKLVYLADRINSTLGAYPMLIS